MTRIPFSSILKNNLLITACALFSFCMQSPTALAQRGIRVGGGARTHMSSAYVPPVSHGIISRPRIFGPASSPQVGLRNLHVRRPIRIFPPIFFGFNEGLWWPLCGPSWQFGCNDLSYRPIFENYVILQNYENPWYLYAHEERDLVWLYLKDGTVYRVSDYWFVNGQVHFISFEEDGAESVERMISMDELDLQKTADVNTRRGFRFVMRDEPLHQYMKDHPNVTPPLVISPEKN